MLLTILLIVVTIGTIIDIIMRSDLQVKVLPRVLWIIVVILFPLLGVVLWFTLGREYSNAGIRIRRVSRAAPPAAPAPPQRPADTRTTEEQIADLDREIEEWRLREEIERRKREEGEQTD